MGLIAALLLIVTIVHVHGFGQYAPLIPNGNRVPNPCGAGIWTAIGHIAIGGTGPRNAFGTAFAANSYVWNRRLCQLDSDGDGISNGVELGDPNCRWVPGSNRPLGRPTGHPGICEPVDSVQCRNRGCNTAGQTGPEALSDDHGWWGGWGGWGHGGHGHHDDHHDDHYDSHGGHHSKR